MPVLDPGTGDTMEYCQLSLNPKYRYIWETSYCNELGHICELIGRGDKGPKNK